MAQEQAKSAPEKETSDDEKDQAKGPLAAMMEGSSDDDVEDTPTLPRRSSLADRLKAEQRRRDEPRGEAVQKREERKVEFKDQPKEQLKSPAKPLPLKSRQEDAGAAEAPEGPSSAPSPKHLARTRRPAGPPPQRRLSAPANDDIPSIGGLIFALQQRPARTPFLIALGASIAWFVLGGFFAFGVISDASSTASAVLSSTAAILVPIVIFWFLALLVWRAQELRLMASAMTEVAVRLAEPDKLAEQSVASVGQTIRRQVAAMNDAISRAIGRASELEAMVHNEVAALERSYGENELRVRNLINELATERDALTNNSQRVSEALKGVGAQISRDIANASGSIDQRLSERGTQLTELLVARSNEAAEQVHLAQTKISEQVPGLIERMTKEQGRLTKIIDAATKNLTSLETTVAEKTTLLDNTMKDRTEALQTSLAERIKGLEATVAEGAIVLDKTMTERTDALTAVVAQSAVTLDKTLGDHTEAFTNLVAEGAVALETTLAQKSEALSKTLTDHTQAFTNVAAESAVTLDKMLTDRTDTLNAVIAESAVTLDQSLSERTAAFTNVVAESAVTLEKTLQDKTDGLTNMVAQSAVTFEKTLADRTEALNATAAAGTAKLGEMIAGHTEALTGLVAQGAVTFDQTLQERTASLAAAVEQQTSKVDKTLADRTAQFTSAVNQGAIALDKTLAERSDTFTKLITGQADAFTRTLLDRAKGLEASITEQAQSFDKVMNERAQYVINALAERLKVIETTFGQNTAETDKMLGEHTRMVGQVFSSQTMQLNEVLANNSQMMQQTAEQVGAQSTEAVNILTNQTGTLREVSRGLLDQIHGLTQRFESQGQAILTAAKALDSSNAKIDSILEGRHQAIISLLHTVNTKAQDLDAMMRNYSGLMENALTQAEERAKQITTSLGHETAGQVQQTLGQIEKLREEAQAHTARAVTDLKGNFETVITQVGRQLEQIRGQFDNTSRGMREQAQKTAVDLDSLRQNMQARLDTMPEQAAQATTAIRKALNDQLREIEAMTPNLTQAASKAAAQAATQAAKEAARQAAAEAASLAASEAAQLAATQAVAKAATQAPQYAASSYAPPASDPLGAPPLTLNNPEPYRQPAPQQPAPQQPAPYAPHAEELRPAADEYGLPPMPRFDAHGRQVSGGREATDLDQAAGGLPPQMSGGGRQAWAPAEPEPRSGYASTGAGQLRIDELARSIDIRTATEVWYRMRAGERGVLGRHIYTYEGQATFDEISNRYDRDPDFRNTVDRYVGDFERLLAEAEQSDPAGNMLQNYLTSETGRVYLLLAHASGRLR